MAFHYIHKHYLFCCLAPVCKSTWTSGRTSVPVAGSNDNWEWVINDAMKKPITYFNWKSSDPSGGTQDAMVLFRYTNGPSDVIEWVDKGSDIGGNGNGQTKCFMCECELGDI